MLYSYIIYGTLVIKEISWLVVYLFGLLSNKSVTFKLQQCVNEVIQSSVYFMVKVSGIDLQLVVKATDRLFHIMLN